MIHVECECLAKIISGTSSLKLELFMGSKPYNAKLSAATLENLRKNVSNT